jgi:hypothetical protein
MTYRFGQPCIRVILVDSTLPLVAMLVERTSHADLLAAAHAIGPTISVCQYGRLKQARVMDECSCCRNEPLDLAEAGEPDCLQCSPWRAGCCLTGID